MYVYMCTDESMLLHMRACMFITINLCTIVPARGPAVFNDIIQPIIHSVTIPHTRVKGDVIVELDTLA